MDGFYSFVRRFCIGLAEGFLALLYLEGGGLLIGVRGELLRLVVALLQAFYLVLLRGLLSGRERSLV